MLKLYSIEAFSISVPLISPFKMAGTVLNSADNLIVRVEDGAGHTGWGEASSAPTMTGETPEGMVAAAKFIASQLRGRRIDEINHITPLLDKAIVGNKGVKAAFETAILDLVGQITDTPMYDLLGGKLRDEAVILTMIAGSDLSTEIADALVKRDAGFIAFKIKVGTNTPAQDLDRAGEIRRALGSEVRISADANQAFSLQEALTFLEGAADAGLSFVEQPVSGSDLEAMAACARATTVSIGADEGFHHLDDIHRHHVCGAAAGGSLKMIKLGGPLAVMDGGRLMEGLSMHVNLAGKVAETSIGSAAVAHMAAALPQLDWDTSLTNQYLVDDLVAEPITICRGRIRPPDAPGLGVTPDETLLSRYRRIV